MYFGALPGRKRANVFVSGHFRRGRGWLGWFRSTSTGKVVLSCCRQRPLPRDARLLKNTTAHVRIILCGVHGYINPKYLVLTRKHGFSLHTIEADLLDPSQLLEGETITIKGQQYQVTKDVFKLVRKT
jgi:hypothetical protein